MSSPAAGRPYPEPTRPAGSRADDLLDHLDYFRSSAIAKVTGLPAGELRTSRLPSGWTPLEMLKHLAFMERRWVEWSFAGVPVDDPRGDRREGRFFVGPGEHLVQLVRALHQQAARTRAVVTTRELGETGVPGPGWDGEPPATLERVLQHVVNEYARHVGHLDIVAELAGGPIGE